MISAGANRERTPTTVENQDDNEPTIRGSARTTMEKSILRSDGFL
jgi:hypothetical protein